MVSSSLLVSLCATVAFTVASPVYDGFSQVWATDFDGDSGTSPDGNDWNFVTGNLGVNAELEYYTSDIKNVRLSGSSTLQIIPIKEADGSWTSGRLESKYVFTPADGGLTRVEASLRFGTDPIENKAGIWPAWWMLGDSIRQGSPWPGCGELDVLETVNGEEIGHGTMHCDVFPGGICNEGTGLGQSVTFSNSGYHTWRIELDRRNPDWTQQAITWYLDDVQFQQVTAAQINNQGVWATVCQSPLFFILNVAVGGTWPGNPNDATLGGDGSMMEVDYVAHYVST